MRVLLTTLNAKYIHVNLALRYLRACCRDLGHTFILDEFTINDRPEHIAAAIYHRRPDLAAFSCYIWNIEPTLTVIRILKTVRPELIVLCGGPEVSFDVEDFLEHHPEVDMVVSGEGEMPFRALMERLAENAVLWLPDEGRPGTAGPPGGKYIHSVSPGGTRLDPRLLAAVPGLAWRQKGRIRINSQPDLTPMATPAFTSPSAGDATKGLPLSAGQAAGETWALGGDLDVIPFPYAEDLAAGTGNLSQRTVYYETSRGCPFACGFCLSSTTTGLRYFSLERVKDDLRKLLAAGVREIKFVDRTFNAHKKRALAIWEFLVSLKPRARFYFEIAADRLDEDMLSFLRRVPAGLFQFEIGVQTINPEVNDRCNRRQDWERLSANVRRLREMGNIRLHLDLIAGLPGETYAGVGKSFDAVAAIKPHEIQLGFLKLLKGTPLRARAKDFGYLFLERPPYEVLASSTITYEEMLRLHSVETMLRLYGNSHLADHALGYLVQQAFGGSHFKCYEALAAWWEEQELFRRGHSQRDLFNHLAAFAASLGNSGCPSIPAAAEKIAMSETGGQAAPSLVSPPPAGRERPGGRFRPLAPFGLERFYQLLKFDFLCRDRSRNFPGWMPPSTLSELERSDILARIADPAFREKYMPGLKQEAPANIRRHGFIEFFPCHPERPEADAATLVFFYYGPGNFKAEVYYLQAPFKSP